MKDSLAPISPDGPPDLDKASPSENATRRVPRALAAWIALGALGTLAAIAGTRAAAWGAQPSARLTMVGSLLAAAVALWVCALFSNRDRLSETRLSAKRLATNVTSTSSGVSGALLVLTAALILRVLSEVLAVNIGTATLPASRLLLSNVMLIASAVALVLGIGLWTLPLSAPGTPDASDETNAEAAAEAQRGLYRRRGAQALWLIDGWIGGGALVALGWWLWRVPAMLTGASVATPTSGIGLPGLWALCGVCSALVMALAAALDECSGQLKPGQTRTARVAALLLVSALALWVWADARFLNAGTRDFITAQDTLLRWMAPLLLGAGVLLRPSGSRHATTGESEDEDTSKTALYEEIASDDLVFLPSRLWRDLWIVVLPCAVILASTWRLGDAGLRAAVVNANAGALWWGPLLLLLAVARYVAGLRTGTQSLGETSHLRTRLHHALRTLQQRTHQLSTLHSATADLSDLRNCEHILTTAIERTLSALDAQSGAVWLYVDSEELGGASETVTPSVHAAAVTLPIETFVWRELERSGSERRALASLRSGLDERTDARIGSGQNGDMSAQDKRWSMVVARGHEGMEGRRAINELHRALSYPGGIRRFAQLAQGDEDAAQTPDDFAFDVAQKISGAIIVEDSAHVRRTGKSSASPQKMDALDIWQFGHIAEIRSKGRVLGAIGIVRTGEALDKAERALVSALSFEAGTALQNVQLYQEMSRLADRDSLTDLFNHRAIQGQLNALLGRAQRSQTSLAVVMMDLNNFKFFNDTYGHPEGDRVLRIVARCLLDVCRTGDIVGRFGGDEFIALLADTDEEGALQACRRIASRVEEEGYQQPGESRQIPITLSFGAAIYAEDGNSALELLAAADTSLYEAKRGGESIPARRNQGQDARELKKLKEAGTGGSFGVLDALVTAIDNKDHYTRQHSEDVTQWASLMARQLEYSSETQRAVRIAGLLHDVGKIAVPDAVLRKPGRLSDDDFNIMQQHPVFGALIVKDVPNLPEVLGGIRHHHERFDGKGYPDKLRGEDIPLLGRLLAVPDCFSAMTTDRPYRKALTWSEAFSEIETGKSTQFDPIMADAFLEVMARIVSGEEDVFVGDATADANEATGVANRVARSMAESEPVATPNADDSQFRPRSVADADTENK